MTSATGRQQCSSMNQELAAPVKGVANAFRRGISQTQRICRAAQNTPATQMLDTVQLAQGLEKSLTKSEARIKDAYGQSVNAFGQRYADALINDHVTTNRLQAVTINLLDQLNSLDDYMFDPGSFDLGAFPYIQRGSENCSDQAILALGTLHQQLLNAGLQQYHMVQDDRTLLPSAHRETVARERGLSDVSPMTERSALGLGIQLPIERNQSTCISRTPQSVTNVPTGAPNGSFQDETRELQALRSKGPTDLPIESDQDIAVPEPLKLVEPKDKTASVEEDTQLIKEEEVRKQISAIDQFLAKRMSSRDSFRDELNRLSMISTSISPISPHPSITASSGFQPTPTLPDSPIINSRPDSHLLTTIMETSDGRGPPVPPKDDPWTNASPIEGEDSGKMLANERGEARKDSETLGSGRPVILPDTPPDSLGRRSGTDDWGMIGIAGTLKLPGFGDGVEDGLEVVGQKLISDPGLIPAEDRHNHKEVTPATSVQSVDYTMGHDSSFFTYGGFCKGAKMSLGGVGGTMKEVTKPDGMYKDMIVMRCTTCSFEADYNDFHRDRRLERSGTIKTAGVEDIEYRARFLVKSHVRTKLANSPVYGCMFCVEENKTLEDQDATIFFSAAQLFRHIQKHPRRLKEVEGVNIIYGPQPENIVNFDLHFLTLDARVSPTADIKAQLASSGTGYALVDHRPGAKAFKAIGPDRKPALHFAKGARIVGITFPACYDGDWCSGYHDSVKALFPSTAVQLDSPSKDDLTMNQKSSLMATAKWDHRPKDTITGWLHFSKKDRITHIAYPYQEFWCWIGMNSKGKWGIFPKDYVDGLVDTSGRAEPALSPGSFASPPTSLPGSHSSRMFTIGSLGSLGSSPSNSAPEKEEEQHNGHHLFTTKRKTSGFTLPFGRRSTVRSHASHASSEYLATVASHESGENGADIHRL